MASSSRPYNVPHDTKNGLWIVFGVVILCLLAQVLAGCKLMQLKRDVWKEPYPVIYASVPPKIDGKLDDALWQKAVPHERFYKYDKFGQRLDVATSYMAWDRDNLYLAVRVKDKDLYVRDKENDAALWQADVAELFVKPRENSLDLYEFEFNVWESVLDIHYISRGGGSYTRFTENFNSGALVKATYKGTINNWDDEDENWTAEVAIPMKSFARAVPDGPKPGDKWRFNVAGYEFSVYRENELLFTSCDGNQRGFAEYEIYPEMLFLAP